MAHRIAVCSLKEELQYINMPLRGFETRRPPLRYWLTGEGSAHWRLASLVLQWGWTVSCVQELLPQHEFIPLWHLNSGWPAREEANPNESGDVRIFQWQETSKPNETRSQETFKNRYGRPTVVLGRGR